MKDYAVKQSKDLFFTDLKKLVFSNEYEEETRVNPADEETTVDVKGLTYDVLKMSNNYNDIEMLLSAIDEYGIGDKWIETKYVFSCQIYQAFRELEVTQIRNIQAIKYDDGMDFYVRVFRGPIDQSDAFDIKKYLLWIVYANDDDEYILNRYQISLKNTIQLDPPRIRFELSENDIETIENIFGETFYYAARIRNNRKVV